MQSLFHLGLHKTGSTSLQDFLLRNQQALAQSGLLYPPVTPQGRARWDRETTAQTAPTAPAALNEMMGHNALAYRLISDALPNHRFPVVHDPMWSSDEAFDHALTLAAQTNATRLLFCSEDLARASLYAPQVPQIFAQKIISRFGNSPSIIMANIRRPDQAIAAWQAQKLNMRQGFAPLHQTGITPYLGTVHLEYRAALAPWLNQFPQAQRHIHSYSEITKKGGTVTVFREIMAAQLPTELIDGPAQNQSMPLALLDIARRALDSLQRPATNHLFAYLKEVPQRVALPANEQIELFGAAHRLTLSRAFEDIHNWLGEITGRIPFFDDYDDMRRPRPLTEDQAAAQLLPALRADAEHHLTHPEALDFLRAL